MVFGHPNVRNLSRKGAILPHKQKIDDEKNHECNFYCKFSVKTKRSVIRALCHMKRNHSLSNY